MSDRRPRSVRGVRWPAALLLVLPGVVAVSQWTSSTASQAGPPAATASRYETSANPTTLFAQGTAAGMGGAQGLVIVDFGRPGASGATLGTVTLGDTFASFTAITTAVEAYVDGYFLQAPRYLHLDVAVGTNNSCGSGQPCGGVVWGCSLEPPSYTAWGAALASTVEAVQAWVTSLRDESGFTDVVSVVAGDDVEPAYDPGYWNTYDLLSGYATAVGGYTPAIIDYSSSEPGFWSHTQLIQVANGFKPDVLVPQLYFPSFIDDWASVLSYAESEGQPVTVFGILTQTSAGNTPSSSYTSMLEALGPIIGQSSIRWASTIDSG
jgi:hypothetical protein